ncbi:MAG: ribosome maturation factor RimM, partial [Buchnera aphidicola]|nr:ribosome maturation factor RimM [Buchnera aphidicola]
MKKGNIINIDQESIKKLILIGKTGKSYGILGWITIFSFSENKKNIFSYLPWFLCKENKWKKIYLDSWKKHK